MAENNEQQRETARPYEYAIPRPTESETERPYEYATTRPAEGETERPAEYEVDRPLEAALHHPLLLYLQFYHRASAPQHLRRTIRRLGAAPYTHRASELDCVVWNRLEALGLYAAPGGAEARLRGSHPRRRTLAGPRDAAVHPLYDGNRPVDFHFLESYHLRILERPEDGVPGEGRTVWWPNLVVRLSEAYRALAQIRPDDGAGARRFFGFFSRPYVRLQRYWLLVDERDSDVEEFELEMARMYRRGPAYERRAGEGEADPIDAFVSEDVKGKTPEDLVAVDSIEQLNDRNRIKLGTVADYLRTWGSDVPVEPRVVRWALPHEARHGEPPTVLELVQQLDLDKAQKRLGLGASPNSCSR